MTPPPPPLTPAEASARVRAFLALLWRRYLAALSARPLRTKCLTAGGVSAASDVLAQALIAPSLALPRTLKFAAFGLCWSGPALHYWQRAVERLFAGAPAGAATAARKVLLDQLTFGPACNIAFLSFFALAVAPRQPGAPSLAARLRADLPRVQLLAWRFWPLVAALNYAAVPPPLRPLTANVAGLFWSTFLAASARRRAPPAPARIKAA